MEASFKFVHVSDLHFSANEGRLNEVFRMRNLGIDDDAIRRVFIKSLIDESGNDLNNLYKNGEFSLKNLKSKIAFYTALSSYEHDAAIAFLKKIGDMSDVDAIVATGDLATSGDFLDLRVASDYFKGLFNSNHEYVPVGEIKCTLSNNNLLLMPGNHDRYHKDNFYSPDCLNFESVFGVNWDMGFGRLSSTACSSGRIKKTIMSKNNSHVAIFMVDFSLRDVDNAFFELNLKSPFDRLKKNLGMGNVCKKISDDLISSTRDVKALYSDCCVIWALHFPPICEDVDGDLELVGGRDFIINAMDRDAHPDVLLSGHTHRPQKYDIFHSRSYKKIKFYNSGSLCGFDDNDDYNFNVLNVVRKNNSWEFDLNLYNFEFGVGFGVAKLESDPAVYI